MLTSFKLDLSSDESKACSRTEYLWAQGPAALSHTKSKDLSSGPHSLLLLMMCGHVGCRASKSAFQAATGQTYGVRNLWGLQEVVPSSASSCCMGHSCVCFGGSIYDDSQGACHHDLKNASCRQHPARPQKRWEFFGEPLPEQVLIAQFRVFLGPGFCPKEFL